MAGRTVDSLPPRTMDRSHSAATPYCARHMSAGDTEGGSAGKRKLTHEGSRTAQHEEGACDAGRT